MDFLSAIFWVILFLPSLIRLIKQRPEMTSELGHASGEFSSPDLASKEFLDNLQDRKIGDFKLPKAAFPSPENEIVPREGFVMQELEKGDAELYRIVASVSAEKILAIVATALSTFGDIIGVVIRDYKDAKVRQFFAPAMYKVDVERILDDYKQLILDNGHVDLVLFSVEQQIELSVDRWKTLIFDVADPMNTVDLLLDFNIPGRKEMQFYQQKPTLLFMDNDYEERLEEMIARLNVEHTEDIEF